MVALERGWRDGGDVVGGILVLAFPGSLSMLLLLGGYGYFNVKNMARKVCQHSCAGRDAFGAMVHST
jgi:hypothetical protein